jgi:transposase
MRSVLFSDLHGAVKRAAQRSYMVSMANRGKKHHTIAHDLGVAVSTVRRRLRAYNSSGSLANAPRPGRPRKVTSAQRTEIKKLIRRRGTHSRARLGAHLRNRKHNPILVSNTTVGRESARAGLHPVKPQRAPFMTSAAKAKRLAWCRAYKDWTPEMWQQVIFTDESYFTVDNDLRVVYVEKGEPPPRRQTRTTPLPLRPCASSVPMF